MVARNFTLVCFVLSFQQGGAEHSGDCTQRSYPLVLEAESDQLCVPALFFWYGNGLSQEPDMTWI